MYVEKPLLSITSEQKRNTGTKLILILVSNMWSTHFSWPLASIRFQSQKCDAPYCTVLFWALGIVLKHILKQLNQAAGLASLNNTVVLVPSLYPSCSIIYICRSRFVMLMQHLVEININKNQNWLSKLTSNNKVFSIAPGHFWFLDTE